MGLFEQFPYTNTHELNLDWVLNYVKETKDKTDDIDAAVTAAEDARDTSVNAAEDSAYSALSSEAWAVGTRNGEAVDSDAPQYNNNSKYWSDAAADSAEDAADFN